MPAKTEDLESRIQKMLNTANERKAQQIRQTAEEARRHEAGVELFGQLAAEFLKTDLSGRLKTLVDHFPNASQELIDNRGTHGTICRFKHTAQFPASVELEITCAPDEDATQFLCSYDLQILPVFIEFQKHDQFASPLEPLNRTALLQWLDDKIIQFLETYLKLEFADQYQSENRVTDPVCQTRINRSFAAAQTTYKGKTYYFLSEDNKQAFEADPDRFICP